MIIEKDDVDDFRTVMGKVKKLLIDHEELRDCDKLLCLFYYNEHHQLASNCSNLPTLKNWLLKQEVPTFATIVRCRAKIQENNRELWGKKKMERYARAEGVGNAFAKDEHGESEMDLYT